MVIIPSLFRNRGWAEIEEATTAAAAVGRWEEGQVKKKKKKKERKREREKVENTEYIYIYMCTFEHIDASMFGKVGACMYRILWVM